MTSIGLIRLLLGSVHTDDIGVEMRHLQQQRIFVPLALDDHLRYLFVGVCTV